MIFATFTITTKTNTTDWLPLKKSSQSRISLQDWEKSLKVYVQLISICLCWKTVAKDMCEMIKQS